MSQRFSMTFLCCCRNQANYYSKYQSAAHASWMNGYHGDVHCWVTPGSDSPTNWYLAGRHRLQSGLILKTWDCYHLCLNHERLGRGCVLVLSTICEREPEDSFLLLLSWHLTLDSVGSWMARLSLEAQRKSVGIEKDIFKELNRSSSLRQAQTFPFLFWMD